MKHCNRCDSTKPESEFYRDKTKRDGLTTKCKECSKTFKSKSYRTITEKFCPRCEVTLPVESFDLSSVGDGYQTACKTCRNLVKRISKYQDFDWNQYHNMMKEQDALCLICKQPKVLVIDHDHSTGKVRGLICQPCNLGLGAFQDVPANLREAAEYLERFA